MVKNLNFQLVIRHTDGFRFITRMNTQVRNLAIISQMVKILGSRQILKQLLKRELEELRDHIEIESREYRNHYGNMTRNRTSITAFNHYLEFANTLELITKYHELVHCSHLGKLLNHFISEPENMISQLHDSEKLLYFMILFRHDADILLLLLELLQDHDTLVAQEHLFDIFEKQLKQRLLLKRKYANEQLQTVIHAKYQEIEYTWKNAKSYSKHIIPPRLEWLRDLGILTQTKQDFVYQLTEQGKCFYNSLPLLHDSKKRDVNESWFKKRAMASFAPLVLSQKPLIFWHELDPEQQLVSLASHLKKAFHLFDVEAVRRVSLYPSLLFMSISLANRENVIAELQELEDRLKKGVTIENKIFSARPTARMNEGYITLNII